MKKILFFVLICVSCLLVSSIFAQETITVATYYPAPLGVYQNLRLFPTNTVPSCAGANDEGTMYYNAARGQVLICVQNPPGTFGWQGVGLWMRQGNNVFLPNNNWNVGIGTNSPNTKLDVRGGVRVGQAVVCNATTGGTLRYRNNAIQFCNGSTGRWTSGGNFGGCYSSSFFGGVPNPFTGRQSCPAGYRSSQIVPWPWSAFMTIRYCYKR